MLSGKEAKSDLYRIATAYAIAKNWGKAEELFGSAFGKNPDHAGHFTLAAGSHVGVEPF